MSRFVRMGAREPTHVVDKHGLKRRVLLRPKLDHPLEAIPAIHGSPRDGVVLEAVNDIETAMPRVFQDGRLLVTQRVLLLVGRAAKVDGGSYLIHLPSVGIAQRARFAR
ncbi:MAG: hypothetical protein V2A71_00470, partial [Candidatus Eisenbacteria bacterium]